MIPILPAWTAEAAADAPREILVTGQKPDSPIDNPPATTVTIDAAKIAQTVNAVSVEDALKYAPSLVIRKRSIGDNFAPIATRTSGLLSNTGETFFHERPSLRVQ